MSGSALVIAHPGHELRIHGWLSRTRPHVFVVTDGSGRSGQSRLDSTSQLLAAVGAQAGSVYGRFKDAGVYAAILSGDADCFVAIANEIADALLELSIDVVVADPMQGYNPTHDLCRSIADAAVEIARSCGRSIRSYDFQLLGPEEAEGLQAKNIVRIDLTEREVDAKEDAARRYGGLGDEVEDSLRMLGRDAFRVECLRPVSGARSEPPDDPPIYEFVGEQLVAEGRYPQALRYRQHFLPIAEALAGAARRRIRCAS